MRRYIVGIDEVGRGPVAGPVYVCAVAIPEDLYKKTKWVGLTDSKLMTPKSRDKWYERAVELEKEGKIQFALARKSALQIDQQGIAVCIKSCVNMTLKKLGLDPRQCDVRLDGGLKAPLVYKKQQTIIKGDRKEKAISLASVIAKVSRDRLMEQLHKQYPYYAWEANKGYGTRVHMAKIKEKGLSALHRKTFLAGLDK